MRNALRLFRHRPVICCDGCATDHGELVPCGRIAVSASVEPEPDGGEWYPTCAHHTLKTSAVPIRELLYEAWREGHQATPDSTNPYDGDPS